MDLSTNDKKRRRLGGDESSEDACDPLRTTVLDGVLRDPDVWLPDGNVVIKAQNEAIERKGRFTVAISGGSLPKQLSTLIGNPHARWNFWSVGRWN